MISIALACYNGEEFIKDQIFSILNQSVKDLELIICDDKSTDNTINIIQNINDNRIKLHLNNSQLGVVKNFEKAISLCSGDYIALSDQDDVWFEKKLEKQLNQYIIEREKYPSGPILLYHDLILVDKDLRLLEDSFWKLYKISNFSLSKNLFDNHITGCTTFFDKSTSKYFLPFISAEILHDHSMSIITNCFGKNIEMKDKLIKFRRHQNNSTSTNKELNIFKRLFKDNQYEKEIKFAKEFYSINKKRLNPKQQHTFEKFIKLENKNQLLIKFYRKILF